MSSELDSLLQENRLFKPGKELMEKSNIQKWVNRYGIKDYDELLEKASKDPECFWDELARELDWFKPYQNVLKWEAPYSQRFLHGKFNIVYNALDRQVKTWRQNKVAYIWEGESGKVKKLTYHDLYTRVNQMANALRSLGVGKMMF